MPNESEQPNPIVIRRRKNETGEIKEIRKENGKVVEPNPTLIGGITEEEVSKKEKEMQDKKITENIQNQINDFLGQRK
ncbi:MAG: hypothetical protein Q7U36_02780 [bacterium]|nr:hypothetical protein [bacterium]